MSTQTGPTTQTNAPAIAGHYGSPALGERILGGLSSSGKELGALSVDDLAAVDEFHIRGREATVELAALLELDSSSTVLDIGAGLGGTARFLASKFGCQVTGIDLTREYCELATDLSARVGLGDLLSFRQGTALELPFEDGQFDAVWTEHVQMNIADKLRFYSEAARVLRPGGRLVFHDVFAGPSGAVSFPVPWAADETMSFLAPPSEIRSLVANLGLAEREWTDTTRASQAWFEAAEERNAKSAGPPALGLHLLMGETAKVKFVNLFAGLREGRLATIVAAFDK